MNENPFDYGMNETEQETAQAVPQNENTEPQRAAFEQPVMQTEQPQACDAEQAQTYEAPQEQAYSAPQVDQTAQRYEAPQARDSGAAQEQANEQTPYAAAQEQPQAFHAQADQPMQHQAGEQYYRPAQSFYQQSAYGQQSSPNYTPYNSYPNYGGYAAQTPPTPPVPPRAAAPASAPKQPKRAKKRNGLGVKVAVLALCCALIGSLAGGAIVGAVLHKDNQQPASTSQSVSSSTSHTQAAKVNSDGSLMTPAQIYDANVPAIVGIANESTSYNVFGQVSETASSGTGFIISSDGEILTNYHVVENATTLTVTTSDGTQYDATVVGYEADSDVALLKIDATDLPTVSLGSSDELGVGDQVAAIGNPLGELTYSLTVGYVSAKDRAVNTDGSPINMMQIDAAINPGNSGGPLFNMYGEVVGITTAKYSGSTNSGTTIEGIGFAIPINDVLDILDDLRENGTVVDRAYLGIMADTTSTDGARIASVEDGSAAAKAGLQAEDVIVAIGDTKITSYTDLSRELKHYRAGDTAEFTVQRSGQTVTVTVTFDAKPTDTSTETSQETQETQPEGGWNPWNIFPENP